MLTIHLHQTFQRIHFILRLRSMRIGTRQPKLRKVSPIFMRFTDLWPHSVNREIIPPYLTMSRPAEKVFLERRLIVDPHAVNHAVLLFSYAGDTADPFTTVTQVPNAFYFVWTVVSCWEEIPYCVCRPGGLIGRETRAMRAWVRILISKCKGLTSERR